MAYQSFDIQLKTLEIEGVSVIQHFPTYGRVVITKHSDYPSLSVFNSSTMDIPIDNTNEEFDPKKTSNFFTARSLSADGEGAKVLIEIDRDNDTFSFAGTLLGISQNLGSTIAVLQVTDLSLLLRNNAPEDFGEQITRRITDYEGAVADYEPDNPVFNFPRWAVPIIPDSVSLTTTPQVTIVDNVAVTGMLSKTNVEIDYRNGRIRFEAPPDAAEAIVIDATWRIDYRYKRPDAIIRLLLDNSGIKDKINITNKTNASFAIDESIVTLSERTFSSNGRPNFADEGITRWLKQDSTNKDIWLAQDNSLLRYDQTLDEYEKVTTISDDNTITAIPPGTYGSRIDNGDINLRPPLERYSGEDVYPRLFGIVFNGAYLFCLGRVGDGSIGTAYHVYRFNTDGTGGMRYAQAGSVSSNTGNTQINYNVPLDITVSGNILYIIYAVYNHTTTGGITYSGNYVIRRISATITDFTTNQSVTEEASPSTGTVTTPHIEPFRVCASTTHVYLMDGQGLITPYTIGTIVGPGNNNLDRVNQGINLNNAAAGIEVDANYFYATVRGMPSANDRIKVFNLTGTEQTERIIDISKVPGRSTLAPSALAITGTALVLIQEYSGAGTMSKLLYSFSIGTAGNYHAFSIFQFDTTDFEDFYCLVSNTFKADIFTDPTFNRNRIMLYDKSANTWSTLLDNTAGQPQIALQADFISQIATVGDNRKNFEAIVRGGKTLLFFRYANALGAGVRLFNATDHVTPPPATQASITMPGATTGNSLKIVLPADIDTTAIGTGGNDWDINIVKRLLRGDTTAGTQAYINIYHANSTTHGLRLTYKTSAYVGAAGNRRVGFASNITTIPSPSFSLQTTVDSLGVQMTFRYNSTHTVNQTITAINNESTSLVTASLIAGTTGTTVMGTQTGSQLYGSQSHINFLSFFYGGADPVPIADETLQLTLDIANKEVDLRVHQTQDTLTEIRDMINATTGFMGSATATGTAIATSGLHAGYFADPITQVKDFSGGAPAPMVTTLSNVYSETVGTNDGLPYSIDFVLDPRTDGIYVYTFVIKRVMTGTTFTSATLRIYRKRERPSAAETMIYTETFTGTAGTDEFPINVSDVVLSNDRSKFYFMLDYYSESQTERGKSELCTIAKAGTGNRKVIRTFNDPIVAPRSPSVIGTGSNAKPYYLQGNWYRNQELTIYPDQGGRLLEITSTDTITDHGVIWRSSTHALSPAPDNGLFAGWGLHSAVTSNAMIDDRDNMHFICGYGDPFRRDNNLPGVMVDNVAGQQSNFVWIQWGKDLATKIPIFRGTQNSAWNAMQSLALLSDRELGFGPARSKVDSIRTTDTSITAWQGHASLFFRPKTILPGKLRTAISATGTPATIGINDQGNPGESSEFPTGTNTIIINKELFQYTTATADTNGTVLSGITRAQLSSTAAAHAANADIFFVDKAIDDDEITLIAVDSKQTDIVNRYNSVVANYERIEGGFDSYRTTDTASINKIGRRELALTVPLRAENLDWIKHIADSYLERYKDSKDELNLTLIYDPNLELGQLLVINIEAPFVLDYVKFQIVRLTHNLSELRTRLLLREL